MMILLLKLVVLRFGMRKRLLLQIYQKFFVKIAKAPLMLFLLRKFIHQWIMIVQYTYLLVTQERVPSNQKGGEQLEIKVILQQQTPFVYPQSHQKLIML
mmetsp:Transcript_8548/g.12746  ORF Transcript_8548/g.12746 Transcript_8548/m.12746 type:complete len:99 (-) Transcript_8548:1233-1529(-)